MTWLDLAVLALYLAVILGLGWRFRSIAGSGEGYFLAGRSMGWFPIGLSVMVTVFSAINYVALPNEVFGHGLAVIAALPVFFLAAWPVTRIWMPFFHRMRLTSAYEYLEHRFDRRVRRLASALFIVWRMFWMATALYAAGTILARLAGLPPVAVILLAGLAATAYTVLGGMRAVMWTDVLQFFVLFGGIAVGVSVAVSHQGLAEVVAIARDGGRLAPFVPFDPAYLSPDPRLRMTLWSGLLGVFVAFVSRYGADQVVMQRYFTARSLQAAQRGLWLNAGVSVVSLTLLAALGLAVYAQAVQSGAIPAGGIDSLSPAGRKALAMQQLAAMIAAFPPGLTGLVVAGLLAATMSSVDSGLNACTAAYQTDFGDPSESPRRRRGLSLGAGLFATALALVLIPLVGRTGNLFTVVNKLINGMGSPLLALIGLGMFSRRMNAQGMFVGGVVGLVASLAVSLWVKPLALQYYAAVNLVVSVVPCVVASEVAARRGHGSTVEQLRWVWRRGSSKAAA